MNDFKIIKIIAAILLPIFLYLFFSSAALAHFPQTDGSINIILHVDPDDNPPIGQPVSLLFNITDNTGKFQALACNCNVSVRQNNKELLNTSPVPVQNNNNIFYLKAPMVFPQKGVYQITLSGKPKKPDAFQEFKVTYNFNTDATDANTDNSVNFKNSKISFIEYLGIGASLIIGVFASIINKK